MCTGKRPIAFQKALTALMVTSWTCKGPTLSAAATDAAVMALESSAADDAESQILAAAFEEWCKLKLKERSTAVHHMLASIVGFKRGRPGVSLHRPTIGAFRSNIPRRRVIENKHSNRDRSMTLHLPSA